jgi:hypothetical protein
MDAHSGVPEVQIKCHRCKVTLAVFRTAYGWDDALRSVNAYEWTHDGDCDPVREQMRESALAQRHFFPDTPIFNQLGLEVRYGRSTQP